jgi:hypothetical protein
MQRRVNPVFRSFNRPLTLMGVERKLTLNARQPCRGARHAPVREPSEL